MFGIVAGFAKIRQEVCGKSHTYWRRCGAAALALWCTLGVSAIRPPRPPGGAASVEQVLTSMRRSWTSNSCHRRQRGILQSSCRRRGWRPPLGDRNRHRGPGRGPYPYLLHALQYLHSNISTSSARPSGKWAGIRTRSWSTRWRAAHNVPVRPTIRRKFLRCAPSAKVMLSFTGERVQ